MHILIETLYRSLRENANKLSHFFLFSVSGNKRSTDLVAKTVSMLTTCGGVMVTCISYYQKQNWKCRPIFGDMGL